MRNLSAPGWRWLWVSLLVFLVDAGSKWLALHYLVEYTSLPVLPFFNLTLVYNTGAAFSVLDNASGWQTIFLGSLAIVVCLIILVWLKKLPREKYGTGFALALILGGAVGNFFDRVYYGHVVDFLDFYISSLHWPAFNIADSAICVGAILLCRDIFKKRGSS